MILCGIRAPGSCPLRPRGSCTPGSCPLRPRGSCTPGSCPLRLRGACASGSCPPHLLRPRASFPALAARLRCLQKGVPGSAVCLVPRKIRNAQPFFHLYLAAGAVCALSDLQNVGEVPVLPAAPERIKPADSRAIRVDLTSSIRPKIRARAPCHGQHRLDQPVDHLKPDCHIQKLLQAAA